MKKLSNYLSIASGVFAVIPGLTVLLSNIGVPPNTSNKLFAGVIEALGVLTLMMLWTNKNWIEQLTIRKINILSGIAILVFMISLFSYIFLYNYLVIKYENFDPIFFPLWTNGDLRAGIEHYKSRIDLIHEWGRQDVYNTIQRHSLGALLTTTLIMLFIYQLIFISLTFAFGILGMKGSQKNNA